MLSQISINEKFSKALNALNKAQRRAVDEIEGPVMVIAGPGTGKTQILACRIGNILQRTDTAPENILCLTYSDAGAVAMRKRLQQFIGPAAYGVTIGTYHSFCNDVIQDNLHLFEKQSMDPVSELERTSYLKELIDKFPKGHPLKRYRGDVYFEASRLNKLFSSMKQERWSVPFLHERIVSYLADLPFRDEFIYRRKTGRYEKGDVKTDKINEEHEKMSMLKAAASALDDFNIIMKRNNRYDFDDMINWVVTVFEEQPSVLAQYQERYLYILVDEYQDTSGSQNRLIELLTQFWERPNLFIVGDDDQSIYRFQGANIENMVHMQQRFGTALQQIVLTENYRSTSEILSVAQSLICHNRLRLINHTPGLTKDLVAAGDNKLDKDSKPEVYVYNNEIDEMAGIIHQIQHHLSAGVSPSDIGVIYKENKYGDELAACLRKKNIAVYIKRDINLLTENFIRLVIDHLRYVASELYMPYSGDEILFRLLHSKWYGISPSHLAALAAESASKRYSSANHSFRYHLIQKMTEAAKTLFDITDYHLVHKAVKIIEELITEAANLSLQQFIEKLLYHTGIVSYILQQQDSLLLLRQLHSFFDFVKQETKRQPSLNLGELVQLLDLMEDEKLSIPHRDTTGSDKGVHLMTAHSSKGLEFEYVIVCGCTADYWEKKKVPDKGYKIPDTVFSDLMELDQQKLEELRRLFYVATTRAKKALVYTYAQQQQDGKENEPTRFLSEINVSYPLTFKPKVIDDENMLSFLLTHFIPAQRPEIEHANRDFIQPILDRFVMNVTALNNFLTCPLQFYYQNLIRVPSAKNEATEFGSAVHYALEKTFRIMLESETKKFPQNDALINHFVVYMNRHKESFTAEGFQRRLEYGIEILSNYYAKYQSEFPKIVSLEKNIKNVVIAGVPLKGKLDKIEFEGHRVNIVDYKSGDPERGVKKISGPSEKEPDGGNYWRQAVFYKLLVDNDSTQSWITESVEFDFIEPDKNKNYIRNKITIQNSDMTTVTHQIKNTWNRIQAHDFYKGCGKKTCYWCHFVAQNNMVAKWHQPEDDDTQPEY